MQTQPPSKLAKPCSSS
jgi:hypothetical protein